MKKTQVAEGKLVCLPDGQPVRIESREGESVIVRRIDGPRKGTLAVCSIAKLRPIETGAAVVTVPR